MNTYKIGNKVTGIIRSYVSGAIGDIKLDYDNQPYTIVKSIEANLTFKDVNSTAKSSFTELTYNDNKLTQVQLSDVTLNDKILNLIFSKTDTKLVSRLENCISDDEKNIYLTSPKATVYQVFIYGADGNLAAAYGT